MKRQSYRIVIQTAIGERCGLMEVYWENKIVGGTMLVFGRKEPFKGYMDDSGTYHITGNLVLLTRTVPFTAIGVMDDSGIRLSLSDGKHDYDIVGKSTESEAENSENILSASN